MPITARLWMSPRTASNGNDPESPIRLRVKFRDASTEADTDPTTVKCMTYDPEGEETTYTYLTDSQLTKLSTGDYALDVTPDMAGRWFYRWIATGTGTTLKAGGDFVVQRSPFVDDPGDLDDYE